MALADLVAYAMTTLQSVDGIGHVYDYRPIAVPGQDIPHDMLHDGGFVHYWSVVRMTTPEAREPSSRETQRSHTLVIRGHMEVKSPHESVSEPAFQALIERIMEAFRPIHDYQLPPNRFDEIGPLSCVLVGHQVVLDTFLLHYAELNWPAIEIVDSRP